MGDGRPARSAPRSRGDVGLSDRRAVGRRLPAFDGSGVFVVDRKEFSDPAARMVFVDAKQTGPSLRESSQALERMAGQSQAAPQHEPKHEPKRRGAMVA